MRLRTITCVLLALAGGLAAGCGSDEEEGQPIPADAAQQLESRLSEVDRRFQFGGGACADISADSQPAVENVIASLPADVDSDVRDALRQGFERLFELSDEQCDESKGEETQTTPEETTESTETETTPTETETTPTETETAPEVPVDPTVPDEGEEDGGSGGTSPEEDG